MFKRTKKKRIRWKSFVSFNLALLIMFYSVYASWDFKMNYVYATETTEAASTEVASTEASSSSGGGGSSTYGGGGSAQDRVRTFISMAAGKAVSADGASELTTDELRFLGIYISNFYAPFFSELGISSEDTIKTQKENMSKALAKNLKFDDSMAEILVDNVVNLSRTNYKELVIKVKAKDENQNDLGLVDPTFFPADDTTQPLSTVAATYDKFLQAMMGAGINGLSSKGAVSLRTKKEDGTTPNLTVEHIYFGYEDGGNFVPVFDASTEAVNTITPSQLAFRYCLGSADVENGYGVSMFDFTEQEIKKAGKDNFEDWLKQFKEANKDGTEVYNNTMLSSKMAVDCFGNIICMGARHQYIVVPGCMNPYTWMSVDSSGNDIADSAGASYHVVNLPSMALSDSGKLVDSIAEASTSNTSLAASMPSPSSTQPSDDFSSLSKEEQDAQVAQAFQNSLSMTMPLVTNTPTTTASSTTTSTSTTVSSNNGKKEAKFSQKTYKKRLFGSKIANADKSKRTASGTYFTSNDHNVVVYRMFRGSNQIKPTEKKSANYLADPFGPGVNKQFLSFIEVGSDVKKKDVDKIEKLITTPINTGLTATDVTNNGIPYIDNMIYIDNLQAFGFGADSNITSTFNFMGYLNDQGKSEHKLAGSTERNAFTATKMPFGSSDNQKSYGDFADVEIDEMTTVMLYSTYAVAGLYEDDAESKKNTIGQLGYRINIEGLPTITASKLEIPEGAKEDLMLQDIRNWIYYLLHPSEGLEYVRTLVKNKVNAILVGWHNDMLGTNNVGNNTGVSFYRSTTGYVTTPDLSEIQWTSSLIDLYNNSIPFLIVIMLIIMLFAFVSGLMSFQKSVFGLVIFAGFLFLPVTLINNVVGISNNVSQRLYGERFTYWAIVQQESYAKAIDEASSGDSYENYLRTLYNENSQVYTNQGNDSIVLKWQAPKKMASLMLTSETDKGVMDGLKNTKVVQTLMGKSMTGENYLDHESDYLYRSYTDLTNFSRYIYRGIYTGTAEHAAFDENTQFKLNDKNKDLQNRLNNIKTTYQSDIANGYTNPGAADTDTFSTTLRLTVPFTSGLYDTATAQVGTVKDMKGTDYVGLHQGLFNFSIPMFNQKGVNADTLTELNTSEETKNEITTILNGTAYPNQELTGLAAYSLMSESPYYYYSWALYDQGLSPETSSSTYKTLILGQDGGGYFYNMKGNGELKDFMDMRSLFTYIIPYLKKGNDVVREWDDVYGIYVYKGVPVEEGHQNDADILADPELQRKYWHNLNVARLYEIYSPWVDLMYDAKYAHKEKIRALGEEYEIEDPLDPASYPAERPMIFSESEMYDLGLTEADLTEVERRILKCNREMEERMYELLNYYNFSDVTLDTAAAINCTFVFNTVFSDNGLIFKGNINLYPQSFEINNFSYDAFLRFILANTIGEDITNQEDFYKTVVDRSSIATAFMLLVDDVLSQYMLPAFKIFFIMAVFVSAVLMIIATAFKVDPENKFINKLIKGIGIPMIGLLGINIGFSWVISLFMGVGNNQVTQTNILSIQTGDPVIALLIIGALDIACMLLYWKLLGRVIDDIKHNFKMSMSFIQGAIGGTFKMVGGAIAAGVASGKIGGGAGKGGGAGAGSGTGGVAENGTGRQSARATQRANQKNAEGGDEENRRRMNEANRKTIKPDKEEGVKGENSKEKADNINKIIEKGSHKTDGSGSNENTRTGADRINSGNRGNISVKDTGAQGEQK